jgi:hypothetical protein
MTLLFFVLLGSFALATRGSALPLHHIKSLMAPPTVEELRAISTHGRFERLVDEPDDLAGGRTNARLAAQFDAKQLVYLNENAMRCDGVNDDEGAVRLDHDAAAVGDVVFDGVSDLCGFLRAKWHECSSVCGTHCSSHWCRSLCSRSRGRRLVAAALAQCRLCPRAWQSHCGRDSRRGASSRRTARWHRTGQDAAAV